MVKHTDFGEFPSVIRRRGGSYVIVIPSVVAKSMRDRIGRGELNGVGVKVRLEV